MMVKKWLTSDFSVKSTAKAGNAILIAGHIDEGVLATHLKKEDGDEWNLEPAKIEAIRVHRGELEVWDEEYRMWMLASDRIRKAYIDYLADKAIFEED